MIYFSLLFLFTNTVAGLVIDRVDHVQAIIITRASAPLMEHLLLNIARQTKEKNSHTPLPQKTVITKCTGSLDFFCVQR